MRGPDFNQSVKVHLKVIKLIETYGFLPIKTDCMLVYIQYPKRKHGITEIKQRITHILTFCSDTAIIIMKMYKRLRLSKWN